MKATHRDIAFCVLASILCSGGSLNADDAAKESSERVRQIASAMTDIFDLVLNHHVAPVTKQQMVHYCLAMAYQQSKRDMPADLVKEISETVDNDRFHSLLQRELTTMLDIDSEHEIHLSRGLATIGVYAVSAKDQIVNEQLAANRYIGIGIVIGIRDGQFPVMHKVFPGGPADEAEAKEDDLIVEVDGKSTAGIDINQTIEWLRGVEGSELEIVLRRQGLDRKITLTRGVVPMATVSPPIFSQSSETVGVQLTRLSASNVHELRKIHSNLDTNVKTVVLDFRSIDSTNLHYGELLACALIDNATIGFVEDRNMERRKVDAEPGAIFPDRRLIVVIDAGTGGVLKWIAAALQDTGQAVVCGDPSPASATTVGTIKVNNDVSVSLPLHTLLRANGERLTLRSELFSSQGGIRVLEQRLVELNGVESMRIEGVLYPDRPFPVYEKMRNPRIPRRVVDSQYRIRDLKNLIESVERVSWEDELREPGG